MPKGKMKEIINKLCFTAFVLHLSLVFFFKVQLKHNIFYAFQTDFLYSKQFHASLLSSVQFPCLIYNQVLWRDVSKRLKFDRYLFSIIAFHGHVSPFQSVISFVKGSGKWILQRTRLIKIQSIGIFHEQKTIFKKYGLCNYMYINEKVRYTLH